MNFDAIENLNPEELASLYDDIIEGAVNIAQCTCGVDGTCDYNAPSNHPNRTCVLKLFTNASNYVDSNTCRTLCKNTCNTDYFLWWSYRQNIGCKGDSNWNDGCIKNGQSICR